MAKNLYNEDSIQSLSPLEHVRTRSSMYIGSTDTPYQLVIEILSNAIDEYRIDNGDTIELTIQDDIVICKDNAQGFIVNSYREDGKSILQAAFDTLNTSGKFSSDGVYEGSALGLHGQGSKIANFLSNWMIVTSTRDEITETVQFKEGVFVKRDIDKALPNLHGTTVSFKPSKEFFETTDIDLKKLYNFCDDITCLCPGLTIVLNNEKIFHENGIQDLLEKNLKELELINSRLIIQEKKEKQALNLAMTFTSQHSSTIIPYVNCGITSAGPHITSIKTTITRTLNKWAKEQGILKAKDKNLDGSSLQEGMILVADITANNVAYNAQIKDNIAKIDTSFLSSTLGQELEIWLDNNPEDGKIIIEKALVARKAAEAAKKARERVRNNATKQTKKKKFIDMPTTLIDANGKDRSKCELIIVEGLSPASSLVAERDALVSAIYSVRGMMLNCRKTTEEKIMQNKEINNLVSALGLDFNPKNGKMKYDKNKLRYGKIIAASDADAPGAAIENLLFNILWYLCPELILNGHVYSAEPPLFKITTKKNKYIFLADQQALNNYMKDNAKDVATVHRAKGLAEMQPQELAAFILDQETRQIKQLVVNDFEKTEQLFEDLYGKNVPPRVDYINNNIWGVEVDYE